MGENRFQSKRGTPGEGNPSMEGLGVPGLGQVRAQEPPAQPGCVGAMREGWLRTAPHPVLGAGVSPLAGLSLSTEGRAR